MTHTIHTVQFEPAGATIAVPAGTTIVDAAQAAGIDLNIPCGGQGRCGRCAVNVRANNGGDPVRRRSTLRLSADDIAAGYALACQTVITGDATITVPPQERIARILTTDKTVRKIELPFDYSIERQPLRACFLQLDPPSLEDQTDDWSRVQAALHRQTGGDGTGFLIDLPTLRKLGSVLRQADWQVTAILENTTWDRPTGPPRVVDVLPGDQTGHLWAAALDIGTTTVSLFLVDLATGRVVAQAADYNGQIRRGEDVISRIIYANKRGRGDEATRRHGDTETRRRGQGMTGGQAELQQLVLETINGLIGQVCGFRGIEPEQIVKMVVSGNPTMHHLFLGLPPEPIRLDPYIPAANHYPAISASELGLAINGQATVDCLPGVASYVGADISAGILGSGLCRIIEKTGDGLPILFLDIGTNGEMVLGDCDWLVTCACSAGPAFEGAGVHNGMRATLGAIDEVWINTQTYEPTISVIGEEEGEKPRGLCGSALISLVAELFITGVIDRSGNLNFDLYDLDAGDSVGDRPQFRPRVREGEHGGEYVVVWAEESGTGEDIVITAVDIDNLLRAKAAIYAGCSVLAGSVGLTMDVVSQVLVGGSFGKHINVEKAVQLGLLPDVPWEKFRFLGNTSIQGAYMALLDSDLRQRVAEIAGNMTYLELSCDNQFYDQFMSALFLPHTDMSQFPSVAALLAE
ncbi:MAG: ASKHA domain-containing protein [Chloroflexota bacterium]|nr:ASKHA domain-containing protein [Chloroflexota bacterium]